MLDTIFASISEVVVNYDPQSIQVSSAWYLSHMQVSSPSLTG